MTFDQVIEHYGRGSILKAQQRIGKVSRQTIYNWKAKGEIPELWQLWFERDTAGHLKAGPKGRKGRA